MNPGEQLGLADPDANGEVLVLSSARMEPQHLESINFTISLTIRTAGVASDSAPCEPPSLPTRSAASPRTPPPARRWAIPVTGTPYDDGDDQTDDALTYSLTGEAATSGAFEIDSATGQISVKEGASLDYETKASYTGKVRWTRVKGHATAVVNVTINLTDITGPETPAAPDRRGRRESDARHHARRGLDGARRPRLAHHRLPPAIPRPRARTSGATHAFSGTDPGTTIDRTSRAASIYEVQVLAVNGEGESDWSGTGTGVTGPRQVSVQRSLPENAQPGTLVGDPVAVTAPEGLTLYLLRGEPHRHRGVRAGGRRSPARAADWRGAHIPVRRRFGQRPDPAWPAARPWTTRRRAATP